MGGGVYDGHRGGYSSGFDTYSTWKNNTPGQYNEYNIDGSWLNNGDYDRAFKGYPSHKTVNIFLGAQYSEPSWKTTLISGGLGLGIQALGMWALGLFGRGKSANQQTASLNFPQTNYIAGFFNTWKLPSLYGNDGILTTQTPNDTNKDTNPSTNDGNSTTKEVNGSNETNKVTNTPNDTSKTYEAKATNGDKEPIKGKVMNVSTNNKQGYPESFEIYDKTHTGNDDKFNIYHYKYVKLDNDKPVYKIEWTNVYTNNANQVKGSQNEYTVTAGITKGNEREPGTVSSNINMNTARATKAAINTNYLVSASSATGQQPIKISFEKNSQ